MVGIVRIAFQSAFQISRNLPRRAGGRFAGMDWMDEAIKKLERVGTEVMRTKRDLRDFEDCQENTVFLQYRSGGTARDSLRQYPQPARVN